MDVPMFSIFIDKQLAQTNADQIESYKNSLQEACKEARNSIAKMGFSSMHSNIVIRDLSQRVNQNTGGGVGGFASQKGKYMVIGADMIKNADYLIKIIVHEWAHLWMFNNSKAFKKAVKEYYNMLKNYYVETTPQKLTREDEDKILSAWNVAFPAAIERLVSNEIINSYLIQRNKINITDFERLPHLFTVWGTASKNISVENNQRRTKVLPEGSKIYATKVSDGWLVGADENVRWETYIKQQVPIVELDVIENVEALFQKALNDYKTNYMKRKISPVGDFKPNIYSTVRSAYSQIARALKIPEKNEDFVLKASEIIWKRFAVWLKTLKPLKDPYDQLWVSNPYKPKEFSISKTLTDQMSLYKPDDRDSVNLSGEKYNQIREVAKDLVKWSDSYGMSDDLELWATGVEDFLKLPRYHRQKIIELMRK
jgi:hypothetical protein